MSVSRFTDKEFKTKKLTENSSKNEYLKTEIEQGRTFAQVAVNELSVSRDQFTDEEFKIKQSTEYSSRGEYVSENKTEPNRGRLPTDSLQKKLSILFEELRQILESDEFDDGLRKYLHHSNPDYLRKIEKCRKDLLKEDHGIVVAGETSAGKSTLINKLLEKRIFKGRNRESTSTICKIRNSEDIRIITERLNGETQIIPLQCSIETESGEKLLRDTLKKLTDLTSSKDSKYFRSVDVGFPITFLKGNTIIVDTPGIGGSGDVSKKVMEYLPYAVSFIFVVDVGSAGGMQNDRLPEILRSIIHLQLEDEMPCFDPKDVIFITNKWDTIARDGDSDEDSSDEDQEEKTWRELKQDIKNIWPSVKEENIFRMNLKHIFPNHVKKHTATVTGWQGILTPLWFQPYVKVGVRQ